MVVNHEDDTRDYLLSYIFVRCELVVAMDITVLSCYL